ncbi:restriction endonuclease subunit S [Streptomyces sp. NA04227]|uniref:restriction endonuclease subunit S n=1 Tax=Streptomyces sp. NA04227 TaxID=2742136 RepID=UPI0020CA4F0F|nr:restriction endonuclease subunit S [Streptomyces sp. NA04227]
MEAVWPGERLDISRRRTKASIAVGYTRFQDGDVLVPKITPTFEAGRAVLIHSLHRGLGAGSTELHVLRPGPLLDPRFLLYLVNTHSFLKKGEAEMYGVAGQQRVPDTFLRDLPVDLPSLAEQRRIADFLDVETTRIDRLLTLNNSVHMQLVERVRSVRDTLVNRLADSQESVPLRRFVTQIEQGASPQCEATPREGENEQAVLKLSSVKSGKFHPGENKRLPTDVQFSSAHEVHAGDFLVTRANTPSLVGDVAVVGDSPPPRLLLPDLIYRVGLTGEIKAEYVMQIALSGRIRSLIESTARGTSQSMVKLRGEDIKEWPIPIVTRRQQSEIIEEITEATDNAADLQDLTRRQVKLLTEHRQALITAAVTGQIDVSTASGRGIEK